MIVQIALIFSFQLIFADNLDDNFAQNKEYVNAKRNVQEFANAAFNEWKVYYSVFTNLINTYNLKKGCEIGVSAADHSYHILNNTKIDILYSIDPYCDYGDPTNCIGWSQLMWEIYYNMAKNKLSVFGNRSKFLRLFSANAATQFKDNELDFVFIDANHTYEHVSEDLKTWFTKVRPLGIIGGDDYTIFPSVKRAVDEFVNSEKLILYQDGSLPRIWWIIKPEGK